MITADRLRELLSYEPETGEFTWLRNRGAAVAGTAAGVHNGLGYRVIRIDGRLYLAHRLCVAVRPRLLARERARPHQLRSLRQQDCQPAPVIFVNLRQSSQRQNVRNSRRRIDNSTGHKGVWWRKDRGKFVSTLKTGDQTLWLGSFSDKEQAAAAYASAARRHFGEFART